MDERSAQLLNFSDDPDARLPSRVDGVLRLLLRVVRCRAADAGDPRRPGSDEGPDRQHQHRGRLRHDFRASDRSARCATATARASPTPGCLRSARFRSSRIAFAQSYEAFLFWRLCIGAIGASFVITQFHTSIDVRAERRRHRECHGRRLGQCGRRRHAGDHAAAGLRRLSPSALEQALGWRARAARSGRADADDGGRVLPLREGHARTAICIAALRAPRAAMPSAARVSIRSWPPRATIACGCCSSPTAPASASSSRSTTSRRSITSTASA